MSRHMIPEEEQHHRCSQEGLAKHRSGVVVVVMGYMLCRGWLGRVETSGGDAEAFQGLRGALDALARKQGIRLHRRTITVSSSSFPPPGAALSWSRVFSFT